MQSITTIAELKNAIQILEFDQQVREQQLKEHVYLAIESLKPVNLIKSTIHEVVSSPHLIDNVLGVAMGLTSGYISKKIVLGKSVNVIRKLFGTLLQFGITNVVAQNSESIKTFGQSIYQYFQRIKKQNRPTP
jgi:hypothetical protein